MNKSVHAFKQALAAADKLNERLKEYSLPGDSIPVSLDNLSRAFKECYGITVATERVRTKTFGLQGMVEIYEDHAIIRIAAGLSAHVEKYVVIKELAHVLTTNEENATTDPVQNIEYMVSGLLFPENGEEPNQSYLAEEIAKIVAIEILFPEVLRRKARDDIENGRDTIFKLAEWLEMPENLVEIALSERYGLAMTALRPSPSK